MFAEGIPSSTDPKQTSPSPGDQSRYIIGLLPAQGMFVFTARPIQPSDALT